MKTSIAKCVTTIALCFGMAISTMEPPKAEASLVGAGIILGAVAIASCIIIKAMARPEPLIDRVLVLERSHFDGNWVAIATNFHAYITVDKQLSIFTDQMTDSTALYRVKDITEEYRGN